MRRRVGSFASALFMVVMAGCAILSSAKTALSAHLVEPTTDPPPTMDASAEEQPPSRRATTTYRAASGDQLREQLQLLVSALRPEAQQQPSMASPSDRFGRSSSTGSDNGAEPEAEASVAAAAIFDDEQELEERKNAAQSQQQINQQQHARSHHNHNRPQLSASIEDQVIAERMLAAELNERRRQQPRMSRRQPTRSWSSDSRSQHKAATEPIVITMPNDNNASQREKFSSIFSGSQDNQPILRVNLLKKSNKPHNSLTSAGFRRNLISKNNVSPAKASADVSDPPTAATQLMDQTNLLDKTEKVKKSSLTQDEAKKSQKMVVSLVKDICEVASKDDLKRMLKEIDAAVADAKKNHGFTESSDDELHQGGRDRQNNARLPDRCLRLTSTHAKYISPHRKRSLEDRLNRAQEVREKFLEYRANKYRDILKKVEDMRAWKEEDSIMLKASVQTKLQKAAAKRKEQLDKIIKKAHDEDSKVSEIQFINNLEAQNRRHDINSRKKDVEARLQDLQDERQRRLEEKQAKEVAVEERRKTLEAERKAKLLEIQNRRKLKNQKVEQQQQVKEKKRIEKNRGIDQKITAIKEAYNVGVQNLKKRINQKQEQSERRHEVNLKIIRQKAFELSIKRYNKLIGRNLFKSSATNLDSWGSDETRRLQLKPFNTKKFCNLCKKTINSESALFSHLRSESHLSSISKHYGETMLTTNESVEIHNLKHIVDTDEPIDLDANSDEQGSSRASSLVSYYHSQYLNQVNGGMDMSESDHESLLAIEKKCRKLRHKLIVAGKPYNREWFSTQIRSRLANLLMQQRAARNQTTNTDARSLANTIDLSANNVNNQHNKPFYLKISRITREIISVATDQRISGGGIMPAGVIHSVDRLLADLNKQLSSRKVPQLMPQLFHLSRIPSDSVKKDAEDQFNPDQLALVTKMIESYAIDTLFLYDIVSSLVSTLRRIIPNVSSTKKLPSSVASHCVTMVDPISLNSYYCHKTPVLPARIYIKMINMLQSLCQFNSDLCFMIFQSNNIINLSDILSYRLGFIIGNESPASSISGSSSAATLSAHTIDRQAAQRHQKQQSSRSQQQTAQNESDTTINHNNGSQSGEFSKDNDRNDYGVGGDGQPFVEDTDPLERSETYKRTEEVVDDMTAGLCKLLATVSETILGRPMILIDKPDRVAFDQRTRDFISYMVSVGIVDTGSVIMSHIHQQQHNNNLQQQSSLALTSPGVESSFSTSAQTKNSTSIQTQSTPLHSGATTSVSLSSTAAASAGGSASITTTGNCSGPAATSSTAQQQSSSSTNDKIIYFTTSCVQFVSSLVKLVTTKLPADSEDHARDHQQTGTKALATTSTSNNTKSNRKDPSVLANSGEELASVQQDQTQLLATLRMTQLSGVLTLVYDMLVNSFGSLAATHPAGQSAPIGLDPIPQHDIGTLARQLGLALHSLRLINYVAYIDISLLQSILAADEMLSLQLRHVCSYLISYLVATQPDIGSVPLIQQRPMAAADASTGESKEQTLARLKSELMNEIILLLGNLAHLNRENQLLLKSGRQPTIIELLVGLPFDYFSRPNLKLVLMPTLIGCAYQNDEICELICPELSLSMLTLFIEDQLLESQMEGRHQQQQQRDKPQQSSLLVNELTNTKMNSSRWRFERRFPKSKWLSAKKYLDSKSPPKSARSSCPS